jgi:hypothetical protein
VVVKAKEGVVVVIDYSDKGYGHAASHVMAEPNQLENTPSSALSMCPLVRRHS